MVVLPRASRAGVVRGRPLTWAPPDLTSPITHNVTADPASWVIDYPQNQDVILNLGSSVLTPPVVDSFAGRRAHLQLVGCQHLVCIGGALYFPQPIAPMTLTQALSANDTTVNVNTTAGMPATNGEIRIDGEGIRYTGITPTSFTGCARRARFTNSGPGYSDTTHEAGTRVFPAEDLRNAFVAGLRTNPDFSITGVGATGTVHLEGIHVYGAVDDFLGLATSNIGVVRVQNCRVEGSQHYERGGDLDAHPDIVQVINGPAELGIDRLFSSGDHQHLLNKGSDSGHVCPKIVVRDWQMVSTRVGQGLTLMANNFDSSTVFEVANWWADTDIGRVQPFSPNLREYIQVGRMAEDPVPLGVAGVNYVSPGYLT